MLPSSGIWESVVHMWSDVSEENITPIFRVENQTSKKQECYQSPSEAIRCSETSVHIQTALRFTAEEGNIEGRSCS
jgi:hypothetical protein